MHAKSSAGWWSCCWCQCHLSSRPLLDWNWMFVADFVRASTRSSICLVALFTLTIGLYWFRSFPWSLRLCRRWRWRWKMEACNAWQTHYLLLVTVKPWIHSFFAFNSNRVSTPYQTPNPPFPQPTLDKSLPFQLIFHKASDPRPLSNLYYWVFLWVRYVYPKYLKERWVIPHPKICKYCFMCAPFPLHSK